MKFLQFIFLLFTCFILFNCNQTKKKAKETKPKKEIKVVEPIKKEIKIKKKEKEIRPSWDTLNKKNAQEFFKQYGKENKETKVLIKTSFGNIKLRLFNDTPIHRANFIFLTKIKYFDTTVFYRVAKNWVVQGGDSETTATAKFRKKYQHYRLRPEFRKKRRHRYGALAAARSIEDNPNKLSSPFNFYIVQNKKGAHHLDDEFTVFGQLISGYSTINKIAQVKVGSDEWPLSDIPMTVEIIE
ncbi:peptidylprolyl isomerase [uncultured Tenacibaculum sp.]|uniref:peptidylprolyl isomerase n=1 Tax=uncultured Tenacibaculum sp. TaxID=174713 RepID=UPI0026343779|nr:peptidylprolyl isomerase [uncultured Tenacibaculum sp.]